MSFTDQLRDVLEPRRLLMLEQGDEDGLARLVLRDRQSEAVFAITAMPTSATIVNFDSMKHLAGIRETKGSQLKKICDCLIVLRNDERYEAVLVEMKKTMRHGDETAKEQLRRSLPLLKYLKSVCAIEYRSKPSVRVHYAVVAYQRSDRFPKQGIRNSLGSRSADEDYEGIRVRTIVGSPTTAASLWTAD